jgi:hypothetical protein
MSDQLIGIIVVYCVGLITSVVGGGIVWSDTRDDDPAQYTARLWCLLSPAWPIIGLYVWLRELARLLRRNEKHGSVADRGPYRTKGEQ